MFTWRRVSVCTHVGQKEERVPGGDSDTLSPPSAGTGVPCVHQGWFGTLAGAGCGPWLETVPATQGRPNTSSAKAVPTTTSCHFRGSSAWNDTPGSQPLRLSEGKSGDLRLGSASLRETVRWGGEMLCSLSFVPVHCCEQDKGSVPFPARHRVCALRGSWGTALSLTSGSLSPNPEIKENKSQGPAATRKRHFCFPFLSVTHFCLAGMTLEKAVRREAGSSQGQGHIQKLQKACFCGARAVDTSSLPKENRSSLFWQRKAGRFQVEIQPYSQTRRLLFSFLGKRF